MTTPAGFVDAEGRTVYYTSALSDNATWTLEMLRFLHAQRVAGTRGTSYLVPEDCGACSERGAALDQMGSHFRIVTEFLQAFKNMFGQLPEAVPTTRWAEIYRSGISELRDMGLVEGLEYSESDSLWWPRKVFWRRVVPGVVELREG